MIRLIEVTQENISNGERGCSNSCAIARALRREYDPTYSEDNQLDIEVEIEYGEPLLYVSNKQLDVDDSQYKFVKKFINDFDNGEDVQPFTLKIREEVRL